MEWARNPRKEPQLRRYVTILMVALVAVALVVSGCGDKKKDEASVAGRRVDMSAQEIFDKTMAASSEITSMTATMDMELEP